eukprot:520078_1
MDDELFTVTLPQSVYSLPFVFPFAFRRHRVGCMFHSSMNAFLLLLNFIIQVAFVIYTRDISAKGNGKKNWDNCTEINRFFLFVLSIFLFCVKTTADIFESLKLVLYLYDFPQANDRFEILKVQKTAKAGWYVLHHQKQFQSLRAAVRVNAQRKRKVMS